MEGITVLPQTHRLSFLMDPMNPHVDQFRSKNLALSRFWDGNTIPLKDTLKDKSAKKKYVCLKMLDDWMGSLLIESKSHMTYGHNIPFNQKSCLWPF